MAEGALTDDFMLSFATVMIGAQADLHDLEPATDSIGLVKNFVHTEEPSYVELRQGVRNTLVHSTRNGNDVRLSMEVHEFTAQNLAYALGLSGTYTKMTDTSNVASNVSAAATVVNVTTGHGVKFAADDFIMIMKDTTNNFIVRQVASVATDAVTVTKPMPAIASGALIKLVNMLPGGQKSTDQAFYSMKVVGKLANGEQAVILYPKVRVTKGFSLAFATSDYGNLPFEVSSYDQVATDPHYTEFLDKLGGAQYGVFRV